MMPFMALALASRAQADSVKEPSPDGLGSVRANAGQAEHVAKTT